MSEPEGRNALGLALQVERLDGLDVDGVFHQPVRGLADQHFARSGRLLEARGDVHGVSGDEPLPARGIAGDDLSRVHADPDPDADPVVAFELDVQDVERHAHAVGRADRPYRIVLVQAWDPEDRHDGIADELLHGSAVRVDHQLHLVEVAAHHAAKGLGVQVLAEGGRPRHVREHDRDDLA